MTQLQENLNQFFAYAAERELIRLRRAAGQPRPWTEDPVLAQYRFCNVDREHDATTVWFREHVRDKLRYQPEVLLATVLFRWFNRISTGEAIFQQCMLGFNRDAWSVGTDYEPKEWLNMVRASVQTYCGSGPYVTGSYIIKTPDGMNKLDGVLWCVAQFIVHKAHIKPFDGKFDWRELADTLLVGRGSFTLESVWDWLCQFPFMGPFMAYEVVTDLRHTALLDHAPDIMTWANPGPGARRGLNRIHGRPLEANIPRTQLISEMKDILTQAIDVQDTVTPKLKWEMRTVEHTLCETDKHSRALLGQGRPRQVLR